MSVADTEGRIIKVICEHFLNNDAEALTIQLVSERVGISRQAFHKNYLHLKPFITGHRAIDELLIREGVDASKVILQTQKLVRNLESEVKLLKSTEDARFREFEGNLLTSLMQSDVLTHRAKELTKELKRKSLHVELLKRQVTELELDQALDLQASSNPLLPARDDDERIQLFKPNLSEALSHFSESQDIEAYLKLKHEALDKMQHKILKILKHGTIRVVVFQERYLCSFDKFVERFFARPSSSVLVINLPLFTRVETKEFLRSLHGASPLEVYCPHCDSEAVTKAQHGFMFKQVPEFERKAAIKEPYPAITDGYDKVTIFRIAQGD